MLGLGLEHLDQGDDQIPGSFAASRYQKARCSEGFFSDRTKQHAGRDEEEPTIRAAESRFMAGTWGALPRSRRVGVLGVG